MSFALTIIIAYALGSISPSIIMGKLAGIDIKKEGSGNAGATNTLRVLGKKAAIITLLVDISKGAIAVFLAESFYGDMHSYIACIFVILGHIFPIWYNFRGGKGVAVSFGALLAVNPLIAFSSLLVVIGFVLIFRMVSLGSIMAAVSAPIFSYFFEPDFVPYVIFPAILIIYMHRSNIRRIINGQENKLW